MENNSNVTERASERPKPSGISSLARENTTESNAIQIPSISLPKGGGALKGIDEKFEVNSANGTASFSIPLPVSPGRNGFQPSFALSYNSGGGNGAFGLGWSIGLPSIQRKTDRHIPKYTDDDVFIFSGVEDLVPYLEKSKNGNWIKKEKELEDYTVKRYRPRIEGGFARIERIDHKKKGTYWRVTTRENVTTIFGRSDTTRMSNPEDKTQIYQWLPELSYDDKGNCMWYTYKAENLETIPNELYEQNRINKIAKFTNQYLKSVTYGNKTPYYAVRKGKNDDPYDPRKPNTEYLFELILDYGAHNNPTVPHEENGYWGYRKDPFSSYRSGFEIRTNRLCNRVLMFHHFEDEIQFKGTLDEETFGKGYLVKSLDLDYKPSSINQSEQSEVTYLNAITQKGYIRKSDTYFEQALPPIEFTYQELQWNTKIKNVDQESMINTPIGLTNNYQWIDLYGEGLSGILTEQGEGWYYKRNNGDYREDGNANFEHAKTIFPKPSFSGLSNGTLSIQDIAGNGQKQLVVQHGSIQGFYELTEDENWKPFQTFPEQLTISLQDPNVRLLDLTGDGLPDIVLTEENAFSWYKNKGKQGNAPANKTLKSYNENLGPAIVFADQTQSIFLADFSGDGLTDIVRIRNGEICYWANKGYGRFSAKITMGNAPYFDHPELFNPQYLHLADVSGTGATDIIYLGKNKFKAFINLSGNAWSDAHDIEPFFPIDNNSKLSVIDLLGTGTSCIVWSSDLPAYVHAPMQYIDLMSSQKPHVLIGYRNNMGKETSFKYKSSTHYYIQDKLKGRPWKTKLPFPVQVVSETIVNERITNVRFATTYSYHHGYYDHTEKEFRGFGRVEQLDSEEYDVWKSNNEGNQLEKSKELYQAPVLTKTWYHTGAFLPDKKLLKLYEDEYWYHQIKDIDQALLPDVRMQLPDATISGIENNASNALQEAYRACKGMVLRQEVFSFEGEEVLHKIPYTVATHNCQVQQLQPKLENSYGVFLNTESEAITFQYERDYNDPRIAHTLNIKIDDLGNTLESAAIVYPRFQTSAINDLISEGRNLVYNRSNEKESYVSSLEILKDKQQQTHITYTVNSFTQDIKTTKNYRLRLPAATKTYEITGTPLLENQHVYALDAFKALMSDPNQEQEYHQPTRNKGYRLIEHSAHVYYDEACDTMLPFGEMASHGTPYESYLLAFTKPLIEATYGSKITDDTSILEQEGKYMKIENKWWIPSGYAIYKNPDETIEAIQKRFFSPIAYRDPFGAETKLEYYKEYYLFPKATEDALVNRTEIENFNFRTLSPIRVKDPNDNYSEVLLNELGLVKAMAIMGKGEEADKLVGLTEYTTQEEEKQIKGYFILETTKQLQTAARDLLKNATARFVYDFNRYKHSYELLQDQLARQTKPCSFTKYIPTTTGSIIRERHFEDIQNDPEIDQSPLQLSFEYSDGLGNVAMQKTQAEPGEALQLSIQSNCTFELQTIDTGEELRWIGNGRTVLNNKGNPVKQYEPYFSTTPFYEDHKELVEKGVTPVIYYDALGRNIQTKFPDGTKTSVVFTAWEQQSYDQNDCDVNNLAFDTPTSVHLDSLGRPILSIAHNRVFTRDNLGQRIIDSATEEYYSTQITLDIEGNASNIIDARGNTVMKYRYDMLGHRIYENSMDAGERWSFALVTSNLLYKWDGKSQRFKTEYDPLQRPTKQWLQKVNTPDAYLIEQFTYGENITNAKIHNLRGQVYQQYDSSGVITNVAFDFKGNLLESTRQFPEATKGEILDWSEAIPLVDETFSLITQYDALNRMHLLYNWHRAKDYVAVYKPSYNERGVLQSEIQITGAKIIGDTYAGGTAIEAIKNVRYDEKGQRTLLRLGNNTNTYYYYDPKNYRLVQLKTTRKNIPNAPKATGLKNYAVLQDLYYTYDATGNITQIKDEAQDVVFDGGLEVAPICTYEYDALDRLVKATGRENKTYNSAPSCKEPKPADLFANTSDETFRMYRQYYEYDAAGNILETRHIGDHNERWTRTNAYQETTNRLENSKTANGEISYNYNEHGSITNFCEGFTTHWDYIERLHQLDLSGGGTAYYQYDSQLERSRKTIEKTGGIKEERLYLGGMEIYCRWKNNVVVETIETHHLMLDDQRVLIIDDIRTTNNNQLTTGTKYRYQYSNHLGSVGLEMNNDPDPKIISYEEYHPYGTVAYHAKNQSLKATAKRYRYTGMERDTESGLNYHSARYYLPWLGRWLSSDPIGVEGGINLYHYSSYNPLLFQDKNGFQPTEKEENVSEEEKLIRSVIDLTPDIIHIDYTGGAGVAISEGLGGFVDFSFTIGLAIVTDPLSDEILSVGVPLSFQIKAGGEAELAQGTVVEPYIHSGFSAGFSEKLGNQRKVVVEDVEGLSAGVSVEGEVAAVAKVTTDTDLEVGHSDDVPVIKVSQKVETGARPQVGASVKGGFSVSFTEVIHKIQPLSFDTRESWNNDRDQKIKQAAQALRKVKKTSRKVIQKISESIEDTATDASDTLEDAVDSVDKGVTKIWNQAVHVSRGEFFPGWF